jgi:hypothetical protein
VGESAVSGWVVAMRPVASGAVPAVSFRNAMRRLEILCVLGFAAALAALPQKLPNLYHDEIAGDPPFLSESGWRPLLNGKDLAGWHGFNGAAHEWVATKSVNFRRLFHPKELIFNAAPGDRIVNGKTGKTIDLFTDEKFGDFELYIEFMTAAGSNSGVYLHGLYEIQIFDSFGYTGHLQPGDCGAIYEGQGGFPGSPPLSNASRPPGEWQYFHIWFKAPRFDASGKKTANAKVLRVLYNGVLVQREVDIPGRTISGARIPEAAENPIMLQGDHGPVAFRNMYIRPLRPIAER